MAIVYARTDIRAGMVTCATAFLAAYPTLLAAVHSARPTRFSGDIPFVFIDFLREDALHTAGTQQRVAEPSFVFVLRPLDNQAQIDLADELADTFMDFLKGYAHIASNMVWTTVRVTDGSEEVQSADGSLRVYPSIRYTLVDVTVMTGRSD